MIRDRRVRITSAGATVLHSFCPAWHLVSRLCASRNAVTIIDISPDANLESPVSGEIHCRALLK